MTKPQNPEQTISVVSGGVSGMGNAQPGQAFIHVCNARDMVGDGKASPPSSETLGRVEGLVSQIEKAILSREKQQMITTYPKVLEDGL